MRLIDGDKLYFTADTHFYHENILKFEKGYHNFKTIKEHDDTIVENWNAVVKKDDVVFHLGDFAFAESVKKFKMMIDRLNGNIVLLCANHDKIVGRKKFIRKLFYHVNNYLYINIRNEELKWRYQSVALFHYPQISWEGATQGSWCLHGHTHQKTYENGKILNVGSCNHDYKPLSYFQIKEILDNKPLVINSALGQY